jgi:hypothetical protein
MEILKTRIKVRRIDVKRDARISPGILPGSMKSSSVAKLSGSDSV